MTNTADAIDNLIEKATEDNVQGLPSMVPEQPKVLTPATIGGLKITNPEDGDPWRNYFFYGDSGVGKTTLAGSACEVESMSPVLIIDVEGGTVSLTHSYPGVHVVRVKSFIEFNELYAALRQGKHPYKTVVLDSATEIQKFGMYAIMKQLLEKDPERDPDLPGIQEWAKNTEQVRRLVRAFRDLPLNTIITALAANQQNDQGQIIRTFPNLSNKLAIEMPGFFDVVGYLYIKEQVEMIDGVRTVKQIRCLLTQATNKQVAKDRTGKLPMVLTDPTMATIAQLTGVN